MKKIKLIISIVSIMTLGCKNDQPKNLEYPVASDTKTKTKIIADNNLGGPTKVYWGDTHLHTALSFDAYTFGTIGRPATAYRYAKGLKIDNPVTGEPIQIDQPLDFLIIADHAEALGSTLRLLEDNDARLAKTTTGKFVLGIAGNRTQEELDEVYNSLSLIGSGIENDYELTALDLLKDFHGENIRPSWEENIAEADKYNEPGKFTAMIGWEWTSQPGGANFHRVIFTKQDAKVARNFLPYSTLESDDPEKLWEWLDVTSEATGAEFLAIPHGPNISAGLMFGPNKRNGEPIDAEFAKQKNKYETAIEITQIKGDSETLSLFSPDDQFADFETYNFLSVPTGETPDPTEGDYVRPGLRNGLIHEANLGINPFKLGMAGGTDSHVGISAVTEKGFAGKSGHDSKPEKRSGPSGIGAARGWDMGAAGFTAVWAKENTREAIFEAFRRKEIYASTGPRIRLQVFAGYDFNEDDAQSGSFSDLGYKKGVPMGGDLEPSPDKVPGFIISAMKDAYGANLDRVQVIKGWLKADGTTEEKVFDVALSDGRTSGKQLVGNTVDLRTGEYTNDIGVIQFTTYWKDPDFNPEESAFYYIRVLEIPTPRYSLYDAIKLGIDAEETGKPATIQERAYSSPIWYNPK